MIQHSAKSTPTPLAVLFLAILSCLVAIVLFSCDSVTECDCEDEISDLKKLRGTPSNFDITESADYNRHEYIYDNADGSTDTYVFEWGDEDPDGNTINVCCRQTVTRTSEEGEETEITNETDDDTEDTTDDSEENTDPATTEEDDSASP